MLKLLSTELECASPHARALLDIKYSCDLTRADKLKVRIPPIYEVVRPLIEERLHKFRLYFWLNSDTEGRVTAATLRICIFKSIYKYNFSDILAELESIKDDDTFHKQAGEKIDAVILNQIAAPKKVRVLTPVQITRHENSIERIIKVSAARLRKSDQYLLDEMRNTENLQELFAKICVERGNGQDVGL